MPVQLIRTAPLCFLSAFDLMKADLHIHTYTSPKHLHAPTHPTQSHTLKHPTHVSTFDTLLCQSSKLSGQRRAALKLTGRGRGGEEEEQLEREAWRGGRGDQEEGGRGDEGNEAVDETNEVETGEGRERWRESETGCKLGPRVSDSSQHACILTWPRLIVTGRILNSMSSPSSAEILVSSPSVGAEGGQGVNIEECSPLAPSSQ